ncbi:MAG: hypothetical protein ACI9FR_001384 [Cryomorphaceae bacterium]|jgi:hypothetical protein
MNSTVSADAPLEDLMAAMDVVDTLRHAQGIAERELDGEGRRERLLARLRKMYAAQGIEVPDRVLQEGIDALKQERFHYTPEPHSWRTKLAHMWVSRTRWGKPVGFLALVASLFSGFYFVNDVLPERQMRAGLPNQIQIALAEIRAVAKNPEVVSEAEQAAASARSAIASKDYQYAQEIVGDLGSVSDRLRNEYSIRVISRPSENSGVWRVPPNNPSGRNYYLIVEAVDNNNRVVAIDVLNQEDNKREDTKAWGLRVSEQAFQKIAADKRDDGIIQGNQVGLKTIGYLQPKFSVATTGATITEW